MWFPSQFISWFKPGISWWFNPVLLLPLCLFFFKSHWSLAETELEYPIPVQVSKFESRKVIYKSNETIDFEVHLSTGAPQPAPQTGYQLRCQIWIEQEVAPPMLVAEQTIALKEKSAQFEVYLPKLLPPMQGCRATLKVNDIYGRCLAEAETLFDVADNWIPVMRMAAIQAWIVAHPDIQEDEIKARIHSFREQNINTLEMYSPFPAPYQLAPKNKTWNFLYPGSGVKQISADQLTLWGERLHGAGMKYLAYNESSAFSGSREFSFYHPHSGLNKPWATYFKKRGMFAPNALKIGPVLGQELRESISLFGWDGVLLDSTLQNYLATAEGVTHEGRPITDKTPGKIGQSYLRDARGGTQKVKSDFKYISQNATVISNAGVREPLDKIYSWIQKRAAKLDIGAYSPHTDMYSLEIDPHNRPRDGRYPLTYDKLSVTLNSIREITGKPLLSWASLTHPAYNEYSPSFLKPFFAIHLASRTQIHDHYLMYTGALSLGKYSPAGKAFSLYNRFLARFSYYMTSPTLRWVSVPKRLFRISDSNTVFWERTIYRRQKADGTPQYVVHILNHPGNLEMLGRSDSSPKQQNLNIEILPPGLPCTLTWLDSDDVSLTPLKLNKFETEEHMQRYIIPPFSNWGILVIDFDRIPPNQ